MMGMFVLLVWTAEGVPGRRRKPRIQCPIPKICGWGCNPERRSIDCSCKLLTAHLGTDHVMYCKCIM